MRRGPKRNEAWTTHLLSGLFTACSVIAQSYTGFDREIKERLSSMPPRGMSTVLGKPQYFAKTPPGCCGISFKRGQIGKLF